MLVRVVAPNFVAGFVIETDKPTQIAPILRRVLAGKNADEIRTICARKGWRASVVREAEVAP